MVRRRSRREDFPLGVQGDQQYEDLRRRNNASTRRCRERQISERARIAWESPWLKSEIDHFKVLTAQDEDEREYLTKQAEEWKKKAEELAGQLKAAKEEIGTLRRARILQELLLLDIIKGQENQADY